MIHQQRKLFMPVKCEIDSLDKKILRYLLRDARMPYLEIARKLLVSGGTIHQRVDKLKEMGIITGGQITIDVKKIGLDVTALLGIHLNSSKSSPEVIENLKMFKEVTEVYYTTGSFALIAKVITSDIHEFHQFLTGKLQMIEAIQSTESFICLDQPICQPVNIL